MRRRKENVFCSAVKLLFVPTNKLFYNNFLNKLVLTPWRGRGRTKTLLMLFPKHSDCYIMVDNNLLLSDTIGI